ncbi:hypothetical protein X801_06759, partial [Opisthorchis viverrini]
FFYFLSQFYQHTSLISCHVPKSFHLEHSPTNISDQSRSHDQYVTAALLASDRRLENQLLPTVM